MALTKEQRSMLSELVGNYTTVAGLNNAIQAILGSTTNIFDYRMADWGCFGWEHSGGMVKVLFAVMPHSVHQYSLEEITEKQLEVYIIAWED